MSPEPFNNVSGILWLTTILRSNTFIELNVAFAGQERGVLMAKSAVKLHYNWNTLFVYFLQRTNISHKIGYGPENMWDNFAE